VAIAAPAPFRAGAAASLALHGAIAALLLHGIAGHRGDAPQPMLVELVAVPAAAPPGPLAPAELHDAPAELMDLAEEPPAPHALLDPLPVPDEPPEPLAPADPAPAVAELSAEPLPPVEEPAAALPQPAPRPATRRVPPSRPRSAAPATAPATTPDAAFATPASLPPGPPPVVTDARYRSPPAPPAYPPTAIDMGITGTVLLRALVDADGGTRELRIHRGSGSPLLDQAALAAARRWAFLPAIRAGTPIEAWVEVPVHFRLN
jgi:protein TonB